MTEIPAVTTRLPVAPANIDLVDVTPADPMTRRARALGLPSATALLIGSIIGTGVFTMPAVMAGAGTSSLLVLGVIAVGALLLEAMFGQLTKRIPTSDGVCTRTRSTSSVISPDS